MMNWKITGLIATLVIVLTIPAYLLKVKYFARPYEPVGSERTAEFVGSKKCMDCHRKEYDKWHGSHHDHAMEPATEDSVLGDFDNAEFEYFGTTSRFYRKADKFFVRTPGPEGKMQDYQITYTFGYYPLQQYLVPFPGGRLQCLPIAWDAKIKKWYHLYPQQPLDPGDWLYWTNAAQTWNSMCADCHSTNLKKNYDPETDSYQTTWSQIDVGCEACHGPGSRHVSWAEMPDMARPRTENYELVVRTAGMNSRQQIELCAPCHSRRSLLGDFSHSAPNLLDSLLPQLLSDGLYFSDGQILEEVYVYGSFSQSKMYDRDVRCSDCHDVHSIQLVKTGNALCLQCHRAAVYDTGEHHFHKKKGEKGEPVKSRDGKVLFEVGTGAECAQCHMPGRYYMGIDYRPDHSLRIPRPDLSISIGTPNACNRCHWDKTDRWSDDTITRWYGPGRRPHYGALIDAGRSGMAGARDGLIRLAGDPLYPVIVRATALLLLAAYPGDEVNRVLEMALADEEPLIRRTAVDILRLPDGRRQAELLSALLYDPVKAVRIEAARNLAGISSQYLTPDLQKVLQAGVAEFEGVMEYTADFAASRYNLGNLYASLKQQERSIENYKAAITIDDRFYPAKVNLAMLYNQLGRKDEAESLLRSVAKMHPELYDIEYSLGLLLAERKKPAEAAEHLRRAAGGLPDHARVHYNLGLLLQQLKRDSEAEAALLRALEIDPDSLDFMYALADYYIKRGNLAAAEPIAKQMVAKYPSQQIGHDILNYIRGESETGN
jgi:predicted CXXCH cytochrome family protein